MLVIILKGIKNDRIQTVLPSDYQVGLSDFHSITKTVFSNSVHGMTVHFTTQETLSLSCCLQHTSNAYHLLLSRDWMRQLLVTLLSFVFLYLLPFSGCLLPFLCGRMLNMMTCCIEAMCCHNITSLNKVFRALFSWARTWTTKPANYTVIFW